MEAPKRKRAPTKKAVAAATAAVVVVSEFHAHSERACCASVQSPLRARHPAEPGSSVVEAQSSSSLQQGQTEPAKPEHIILQQRTTAKDPDDPNGFDVTDSGDVQGYQEQTTFSSEPSAYLTQVSSSRNDALGTDVKLIMPNLANHEMWPAHVNSACFWCAHTFASTPVGLPVKVKDGKLHTTGCFCSVECAAAFNFNCTELGQNKWHSYQLLNRLARKLGCKGVVRLASSRFALKLFGGWMEIDEFRASHHAISPLPHPMVPVVQYMEEIVPVDANKKPGSFVPLDVDRVQKATNNILNAKSKKNTIQNKMHLLAAAT